VVLVARRELSRDVSGGQLHCHADFSRHDTGVIRFLGGATLDFLSYLGEIGKLVIKGLVFGTLIVTRS